MEKDVIIVIIIIFVILLCIIIGTGNAIIKYKKKIERNRALVDVFLKKRYDLIPNLVEVCKGYAKFENETLKNITELRRSYHETQDNETLKELNKEYQKIIAIVENYPNLKASEQFLKLQKEITNVENELQASRRIYINSITSYNNLVMRFPSSLIAKMMGYCEERLPKYEYDEVHINFK